MKYSKEGDRITLEMTQTDYERLLLALGYAAADAYAAKDMPLFHQWLHFVNEMNRDNPNFRQYEIAEWP